MEPFYFLIIINSSICVYFRLFCDPIKKYYFYLIKGMIMQNLNLYLWNSINILFIWFLSLYFTIMQTDIISNDAIFVQNVSTMIVAFN